MACQVEIGLIVLMLHTQNHSKQTKSLRTLYKTFKRYQSKNTGKIILWDT